MLELDRSSQTIKAAMLAQPIDLPDAYYRIPVGKLVNAVTWLEMRSPPSEMALQALDLVPVTQAEGGPSRELFKAIGAPWLWSQAYAVAPDVPTDGDDRPSHHLHFAYDGERRVGLVGFDDHGSSEIELTWFGLIPEATGRGLGRRMMAAALRLAWASKPDRIWLHTCHYDHPGAVRFYQACGFVPYASGFEIMDDPRLNGQMPRTAAPQIPLIDP